MTHNPKFKVTPLSYAKHFRNGMRQRHRYNGILKPTHALLKGVIAYDITDLE